MIAARPVARIRSAPAQNPGRGDWKALREFARAQNQIPDDVYEKDEHFWEVLMHKLICNRLDMLAQHETSRAWLAERGYTPDIGGY